MILNDGSHTPDLNGQLESPPQTDQQYSTESFYNHSPTRVPQRIDSSDDEGSSPESCNRVPSVTQAQQASHMKGIVAGHQLQIQTDDPPSPPISIPSETQLQTVARTASNPANVSFITNVHVAPVVPPKSSDYSPLAAFLGLSNPSNQAVPKNANQPSSAASGSLLSAFLGRQLSEHSKGNLSLAPLVSVPPTSHLPTNDTTKPQPAEKSAELEEPIRLKAPSLVGTTWVKETHQAEESAIKTTSDISPNSHSSPPSRALNQLAARNPETIHPIDPIRPDLSSVRKQPKAEPAPSSLLPRYNPVPLAPSIPSSTRTTSLNLPTDPTGHILENHEKSMKRDMSTSISEACDMIKMKSFQKCASKNQSVEKIYLNPYPQDSSISSDSLISVDDAIRKCIIDSGLSSAFTSPSLTWSQSSPASALESLIDNEEDSEVEIEDVKQVNILQECISRSDRLKELKNISTYLKKGTTDAILDKQGAVAEDDTSRRRTSNFEHLLLRHPEILREVINRLDYIDFYSLSHSSKELLEGLEEDERTREVVLKRYLANFGYRTCPPGTRLIGRHGSGRSELPTITLDDLANLYAGLELDSLEYLIQYSKQPLNRMGSKNIDQRTAKIIRSSTRAHNKLVALIRAVDGLSQLPESSQTLLHSHTDRVLAPFYRSGKAPVFKVWVPSVDYWMSNDELAECEQELWRSQIWLKKGDVCWNLALGDFANQGKLLFDGRFLRDLLFDFDDVGHLPSWLDMLGFPPSYYHRVISSTTTAPIFYLDLSKYVDEIKRNWKLSEDQIEVQLDSSQASYRAQRRVYRSIVTIPNGNWRGHLVIEVEGTSENLKDLLERCRSSHIKKLTPWRIIRQKSRPGKVWIRPVNNDERMN